MRLRPRRKSLRLPAALPPQALATPHVVQTRDWDCGLAAVSMVLRAAYSSGAAFAPPNVASPRHLARLLHQHTIDTARALGSSSSLASNSSSNAVADLPEDAEISIWTIDLAFLLRHFEVEDFTFFTSFIGVNFNYSNKAFYRDSISLDRRRVHTLFGEAAGCGVRVVPMILALEDIRRFLASGRYVVIMLVNLADLQCGVCGGRKKRTKVAEGSARRCCVPNASDWWCISGFKSCFGESAKSDETTKAEHIDRLVEQQPPSTEIYPADSGPMFVDGADIPETAPLLESSSEKNIKDPEASSASGGYLSFFWSAIFGDISDAAEQKRKLDQQNESQINGSAGSKLGSPHSYTPDSDLAQASINQYEETNFSPFSVLGSPPSGIGTVGRLSTPPTQHPSVVGVTGSSPQIARVYATNPVAPIEGAASYPARRSIIPPSVEHAAATLLAAAAPNSLLAFASSPPSSPAVTHHKPSLSSNVSQSSPNISELSNPPLAIQTARKSSSSSLGNGSATPPSNVAGPFATSLSNTPLKNSNVFRSPSISSPRQQSSTVTANPSTTSPFNRRPSTSKSTHWTSHPDTSRRSSTSNSSSPLRQRSVNNPQQHQEEFVGHYVLLVGYDHSSDIFMYRDPGTEDPLCVIDGDGLEIARGAPGSDHDAIVVRVR